MALFAGLPEAELAELNGMCRRHRLEPGKTIAYEQDELSHISFVIKGVLRMRKTLPDGREHIVGLLAEGDMFGRVFDGPMHFAIEAASEAEILSFPRSRFEDLLKRSPELERQVMLNILSELDAAREWMLILGNHRTVERLAGFLLVLCRRLARPSGLDRAHEEAILVHVPVSRADVANFLGTRPESVSRAFHALDNDKLIRMNSPYDIEILDLGALIDLAGMDELDSDADLLALNLPDG